MNLSLEHRQLSMRTKKQEISYEIVIAVITRFFAGLSLLRFVSRIMEMEPNIWLFERLFELLDFIIYGGLQKLFFKFGLNISDMVAELAFLYLLCIGFMSRSIGYSKRMHLIAPERRLDDPIPKQSSFKEKVYARKPVSMVKQIILSIIWPYTIALSLVARKPNTRKVYSFFRMNFMSEVIQAFFAAVTWFLLYLLFKGISWLVFNGFNMLSAAK